MKACDIPCGHVGKSNNGSAVILVCEDYKVVFLSPPSCKGDINDVYILNDDYEDLGELNIKTIEQKVYKTIVSID
jgi:tartrate dehydratase beta subunit/fumarate hydratase class I family protein